MNIFVSATDTEVGKTVISTWLALHTGFTYFKPIQTGTEVASDTKEVKKISGIKTCAELYRFKAPLSPHLAATREGKEINWADMKLPHHAAKNFIIEGAGGLLVPINRGYLMIDLIQKFQAKVILVARTGLGTINHTLLSLEALRKKNIPILGVILNGKENKENSEAIEFYGKTNVFLTFPILATINATSLKSIELPQKLRTALQEEKQIK